MTSLPFDVFWNDRGAQAGLRGLATQTAATQKTFLGLKAATETAAAGLAKARDVATDSVRKVRIEEQKLQELRDSGKAKASQLLAAEDRLATARRRSDAAIDEATKASRMLERAEKDEAAALSSSSSAAGKAERGIASLRTETNHTAASAGKLGSALGGFAGIAAKTGVGAALALAAGGAAAAGYGLKVASANEQASISFTTMLGSAKKARSFLGELQKFAAATPFEFPELQTAASSLISAGINASKVIPIMRTLGDVTSGMGTGSEGVQRATVALQQMSAAGKISAEDLNQLRDAGIPVYDLLAKATGKSKAEVVKLAQAGKLGKKELGEMMDALEKGKGLERFSGLMDKQSQSLAGMWSTLKDTVGQGLAQSIAPAFPLIKSGLGTVSNALGDLFKWVSSNKGSISGLFSSAGSIAKSFGSIVSTVFGSLADSLSGGKASFKSFSNFISTHQAEIVGGFIVIAKTALQIGRGILTAASLGLRGFATIMDSSASLTAVFLKSTQSILQAATIAFSWIPGIGPKLRDANDKFTAFATGAVGGMRKAADGARAAADGIDHKLKPALDQAGRALDNVSDKEIVKAKTRDAAKKAALAINDIGTSADGSQIKLKKFADKSKLSADEQAGLSSRLHDATHKLADQLKAMKDGGAGQDKLTAAWKTGKARLYDEFKQMGLSNDAAKKLAARYAGVPPKVKTVVSQPGMPDAIGKTVELDRKINGINGKTVKVKVLFDAGGKISIKDSSGHRGPQFTAAKGAILPGYTPGRDVHLFTSPTGGTIGLSGGEGIARPEVVQAMGATRFNGLNAAARSGGAPAVRALMGFADGGITRFIKVSGSTSGGVPLGSAIATAASDAAWAGKQDASWASRQIMAYVKKKTAEAADGPIGGKGYANALRWARAQGGPYIFGGVGPRGYDCSGFMSAIDNVIHGRAPHHRLFSTQNFHGQAHGPGGFHHNKRSPFMIGVHNGGPGGGHMAGTLNGVNVESSGGRGAHTGHSARGWHSGMFGMHYGLKDGGLVGDLPWDTINPQGNNYNPEAAALAHRLYGAPVVHDRGGLVPPGDTLVRNGTRRPERMLTDQQNRAFENMVRVSAGGQTVVHNHYTVNAPNYVGPQRELVNALVSLNQRGALKVIKDR